MAQAPLLIRAATVADARGVVDGLQDLVLRDGRIERIGPSGSIPSDRHRVVDAGGGVCIPGLVNAHLHSNEIYMRGQVWGLPLEPYILRISPRYGPGEGPTPDDVYDRTLAACAEMLLGGITCAIDDVIHPRTESDYVDAALRAYDDSGMRARVSILVTDQPWSKSIPFLGELATGDLADLAMVGRATEEERRSILELYERSVATSVLRSPRVGLMVSPSAPQRSSPEFLGELWSVAESHDLPFHIHVQESVGQGATGPDLFGHSMLRELDRLGLLTDRTMVAHGIWLDDGEIELVAARGATVAHNPVSNLKLGSGIARVRDLRAAGARVGLGCDGYTCNDALDMVEAMKFAVLLSDIASSDPDQWLTPREALTMATVEGARAARLGGTGLLEPGSPADLVIFDVNAPAFVPLRDPIGQLVLSAKAADVRSVVVDGELVVEDRHLTRIDLPAIQSRIREAAARESRAARSSLEENERLMPAFMEGYRRSVAALGTMPEKTVARVAWRSPR